MKLTSISKSKSKSKGLNRVVSKKKLDIIKNQQKSAQVQRYRFEQLNKQNNNHKTGQKKSKGHITLSQSLKDITNVPNQPLKETAKLISSITFNNIQTITDQVQENQHSYFSQVFINNHKYVINNHHNHQKHQNQQKNQKVEPKFNMFQVYSQIYQPQMYNFQKTRVETQTSLSMFNIQELSSQKKLQNINQNVMVSSVGELMNKKRQKKSNKKKLDQNNNFIKDPSHKLNFDNLPLESLKQNSQNQQQKQAKTSLQIQSQKIHMENIHFPDARLCETRILSQKKSSFQIQNDQCNYQLQGRTALQDRLAIKTQNMHLLKNKSNKNLFGNSKQNINFNYTDNCSTINEKNLNSSISSQKYKSQILNNHNNTSLNKIFSNQNKSIQKANNSTKKRFKHILNSAKRQNKDRQICKEDFVFGKKIGRGRFGNVYIAQHFETQSVFAIKSLDIKQIKEENMQEQIVSEIKLQSFLNHPNILKLYGFFKDQTKIYLILELADMCLYKMMKQTIQIEYQKRFQQQKVAYYAKQMLQSMKYIHSQNIIHRDIKPQNIMIAFQVLKLGDFGWSVYSPTYKRQTFCGTLQYVSPQVIKGQFYDEKVDIWSYGILLYELFHGYAPFQTQNQIQEQTFQKILQGKINFQQRISYQLQQLIETILHQNPDRRIKLQDIDESLWIQKNQKQGRLIDIQIWESWQKLSK